MIVRTFCDNGYKYDEDSTDIELNDIQDIEAGALEHDSARYNLAQYLTESGRLKIENIYPNFPWKSCYHGIRMITPQQLEMERVHKERQEMIVEENKQALLDGRRVIGEYFGYDDIIINHNLLIKKGWEFVDDPVFKHITEEEKNQMIHEGFDCFSYYKLFIDNKYSLIIRHMSNTDNRDWTVHVDNDHLETMGSCDIQTIKHFNKFMDVLDIPYRL